MKIKFNSSAIVKSLISLNKFIQLRARSHCSKDKFKLNLLDEYTMCDVKC